MRTLFLVLPLLAAAADLRVGIIGTDTSHVPAFTTLLNDPAAKNHVPGARVVAAFKGGSPDLPDSWNRVDKYAAEIEQKHGVKLVASIADLCPLVDAILLESVDGRPHLAQARQAFACGKPVFIDKPLAATLADARAIAREAKARNVKWFSSSALRFSEGLPKLRIAGLNGAVAWGPGPHHPTHTTDMTWYGIHTVEILYALLGPGCVEVTRTSGPDGDVVTGRWNDGRVGTVRTIRPYGKFGATVFSAKETVANEKDLYTGYGALVTEIVKFFQTGVPPVKEEETLEMFEFMDAAQRSLAAKGAPVAIR